MPHSAVCKCPLCDGDVSLLIVTLRASFDCPCCGKALKVHGTQQLVIRLTAMALGFLLARGVGLESISLFCTGLVIWPFLVIPVWRASVTIKRPVLISAIPVVTTLGLGSK